MYIHLAINWSLFITLKKNGNVPGNKGVEKC